MWNNNKCLCETKNPKDYHVCEKIWACLNGKHLGNIIENSVITCDKIVNITHSVSENFQ